MCLPIQRELCHPALSVWKTLLVFGLHLLVDFTKDFHKYLAFGWLNVESRWSGPSTFPCSFLNFVVSLSLGSQRVVSFGPSLPIFLGNYFCKV